MAIDKNPNDSNNIQNSLSDDEKIDFDSMFDKEEIETRTGDFIAAYNSHNMAQFK